MSSKKGYSSFLSARVRHRPVPPVSLSPPDMTATPPLVPPLTDPTPIWIGAVMAKMEYEKQNYGDSQEDFFRQNPRVRRNDSPHPLVPPVSMIRHFLEQRYGTRVYYEILVADPDQQPKAPHQPTAQTAQ